MHDACQIQGQIQNRITHIFHTLQKQLIYDIELRNLGSRVQNLRLWIGFGNEGLITCVGHHRYIMSYTLLLKNVHLKTQCLKLTQQLSVCLSLYNQYINALLHLLHHSQLTPTVIMLRSCNLHWWLGPVGEAGHVQLTFTTSFDFARAPLLQHDFPTSFCFSPILSY